MTDTNTEIKNAVEQAVSENEELVERYKQGKEGSLIVLVEKVREQSSRDIGPVKAYKELVKEVGEFNTEG